MLSLGYCLCGEWNSVCFNNAPSVQNKYGGNIVFQSLDEFIGTGVDERKMLDVYSSPLNESQILEYVNEMLKNGEESTQLGRVLEAFIVVSLIYLLINKK